MARVCLLLVLCFLVEACVAMTRLHESALAAALDLEMDVDKGNDALATGPPGVRNLEEKMPLLKLADQTAPVFAKTGNPCGFRHDPHVGVETKSSAKAELDIRRRQDTIRLLENTTDLTGYNHRIHGYIMQDSLCLPKSKCALSWDAAPPGGLCESPDDVCCIAEGLESNKICKAEEVTDPDSQEEGKEMVKWKCVVPFEKGLNYGKCKRRDKKSSQLCTNDREHCCCVEHCTITVDGNINCKDCEYSTENSDFLCSQSDETFTDGECVGRTRIVRDSSSCTGSECSSSTTPTTTPKSTSTETPSTRQTGTKSTTKTTTKTTPKKPTTPTSSDTCVGSDCPSSSSTTTTTKTTTTPSTSTKTTTKTTKTKTKTESSSTTTPCSGSTCPTPPESSSETPSTSETSSSEGPNVPDGPDPNIPTRCFGPNCGHVTPQVGPAADNRDDHHHRRHRRHSGGHYSFDDRPRRHWPRVRMMPIGRFPHQCALVAHVCHRQNSRDRIGEYFNGRLGFDAARCDVWNSCLDYEQCGWPYPPLDCCFHCMDAVERQFRFPFPDISTMNGAMRLEQSKESGQDDINKFLQGKPVHYHVSKTKSPPKSAAKHAIIPANNNSTTIGAQHKNTTVASGKKHAVSAKQSGKQNGKQKKKVEGKKKASQKRQHGKARRSMDEATAH